MGKPIIGITTNTMMVETGSLAGLERYFASHDYVKSVLKAGGVPVLLPDVGDEQDIKAHVKAVDGIVFSGGTDVDPLLFQEEPVEKMGPMLPARDHYEIALAQLAVKAGKPILGICRGPQVINVAFGGSLHQDVTMSEGWYVKHSQNAQGNVASHTVSIIPNTRLYNILGSELLVVNSFHHQAVKDIAPGFVAAAWSKDGIIEAIEMPGDLFVVAVQWHPELMIESYPVMLSLFRQLVTAASQPAHI
jgi:putative glutamine amidotransferase